MASKITPLSIEQAQIFFSNLCNFLPHYVFWKDKNSIYLGCNENYAQMIGLSSPAAIVGLKDSELPGDYFRTHAEEFIADDKKTMTGQPIVDKEYIMPQPQGDSLNFLVNKKAIYDKNGEVLGVLGFVTDVTSQKRAELELLVAKQQAESSAQEVRTKSDYIANISHDLRTPLNGIVGMAERLQRLNLDASQQETVACIIQGSHTLLSLVDDILQVAKLEAGKLQPHKQHFNFKNLIAEALATITFAAQQKNITLVVDYDAQLPNAFIGDSSRIKRVILNLLGNAIKFTDQGQITIGLQEKSRQGQQTHLEFYVKDTGTGIPADKLDKVFDRFETGADPSADNSKHGAGLGLTIVKEFIEEMGGTIRVESEEGKGTIFYCTLPLDIHLEKKRLSAWAEQFPDVKILMIDDTPERSEVLLSEIGPTHLTAIASHKIMDLLEGKLGNQDYNIIFISDALQSLDAASLCHLFHQNSRFAKAMKIVFGEHYNEDFEKHLQEQGCFMFLPWQNSYIDTLSDLAKCWHQWKNVQASKIMQLQDLNPTVLLVEDNELNQKVIAILLAETGCQVKIASNGQEALNLINQEPFDVVFLDIGLPDMNGITVARKIRQQEASQSEKKPALPIVALTGHVQNENKNICLDAGMNWFLSKPVSADELKLCLSRILL